MNFTGNLLFVYDYFYPAYKAGGPIQSLSNLLLALQNRINVSVLCSTRDLHQQSGLEGIQKDEWSSVNLPGTKNSVPIWYAEKLRKNEFVKFIQDIQPGVIYLNGIFSFRFFLIPLLAIDKSRTKVVICPRGMLQTGALARKSLKKKIYLTALKLSGVLKNLTWHATNADEERDIKKIFSDRAKVFVAANIPRPPLQTISACQKKSGQLRLVYLSLIAEKKNLLQVIELVNQTTANISLDIYGPEKDVKYLKRCKQAIATGKGNIKYIGDIRPELVQDTFSRYDASILLTKGENFGHALYESLSAGRPIITSYFTPWNELEEKKAGWNLNIADNRSCLNTLQSICMMDSQAFSVYCNGAYERAKTYYREASDLSIYYKMFGYE